MDDETRKFHLRAAGLSERLLAVDPRGCGCTECLIGEYIPVHEILSDLVPMYQRLIEMGVLVDHTDGWFMPVTVGVDTLVDAVYQALVSDGWLRDRSRCTLNSDDIRAIAEVAILAVLEEQA